MKIAFDWQPELNSLNRQPSHEEETAMPNEAQLDRFETGQGLTATVDQSDGNTLQAPEVPH